MGSGGQTQALQFTVQLCGDLQEVVLRKRYFEFCAISCSIEIGILGSIAPYSSRIQKPVFYFGCLSSNKVLEINRPYSLQCEEFFVGVKEWLFQFSERKDRAREPRASVLFCVLCLSLSLSFYLLTSILLSLFFFFVFYSTPIIPRK